MQTYWGDRSNHKSDLLFEILEIKLSKENLAHEKASAQRLGLRYQNWVALYLFFDTTMSTSSENKQIWSLYLIRCCDNSLYTGISNDISARWAMHQSGHSRSAKYLRGRHPLSLVFTAAIGTKSAACKAEKRIKKLNKCQKEQIIVGSLALEDVGIAPKRDKV